MDHDRDDERRGGSRSGGRQENRTDGRADKRAQQLERARERNQVWARRQSARGDRAGSAAWTRQSWTLPRAEARAKAREFFRIYPKAAYATEVESWRVLPGDIIEFTMRRLPSAD